MAKVKMLSLYASADGVFDKGIVADIDDKVASNLVVYGYAEFVDAPPVVEEKKPTKKKGKKAE
jgi:hypothetical protein